MKYFFIVFKIKDLWNIYLIKYFFNLKISFFLIKHFFFNTQNIAKCHFEMD